MSCGAYDLLVTLGEETYSAGTLETAEVTALENEQTIFTLPSARYVQGEVAPGTTGNTASGRARLR